MGLNYTHPPTPSSPPGTTPTPHSHPRHSVSLPPSQTELPSCLNHHTKSQATGQKTQLFSAVTLLNLIFPTSSLSCSSRMKCIFGFCHKTLHFVKAIHFAVVICKYAPAPVRAGGFYGGFWEQKQEAGDLCGARRRQ